MSDRVRVNLTASSHRYDVLKSNLFPGQPQSPIKYLLCPFLLASLSICFGSSKQLNFESL